MAPDGLAELAVVRATSDIQKAACTLEMIGDDLERRFNMLTHSCSPGKQRSLLSVSAELATVVVVGAATGYVFGALYLR